jgi:hypothetical protein
VTEDEGSKITVTDTSGNAVAGKLTSAYGGLEWTFTPDEPICGTGYTLTVPEAIVGNNGKTIQSGFVYDIDFGNTETACACSYLNVETKGDRRYLAFEVKNDGVNTVSAYTADGSLLGKAGTSGKGWYKIDVTELGEIKSDELILKAEKAAKIKCDHPALTVCGNAIGGEMTAPDGSKAVGVTEFKTITRYPTEEFYSNPASAVVCNNISGEEPLSESDLGRRFRVSFKVYDTASRYIGFGLNHCSHRPSGVADYNRVICNEITRKDEWMEFSFDYTVYEPVFGELGKQKKSFYINRFGRGNEDSPIYFADLKCEETVTDVVFGK